MGKDGSTIIEEKRELTGKKTSLKREKTGKSRGLSDSKTPNMVRDSTELFMYCPVGLTASKISSSNSISKSGLCTN